MLLDVIPDDTWWRNPALATPLNLSSDQFTALDRIANDQRDEIARLERDLRVATRDLRSALDRDRGSDGYRGGRGWPWRLSTRRSRPSLALLIGLRHSARRIDPEVNAQRHEHKDRDKLRDGVVVVERRLELVL